MVVGPSGPGAAGQRVFDLIVVARARVIAPSHMEVVYKGALELLPGIAKGDHDLRGDDNANSRARNQCRTDYDVMEVAGAFVRIAPSGPSSHDPGRCSHAEENGSAIDRDNDEGHAAETNAVLGRHYTSQRKPRLRGRLAIPVRYFRGSI
jgi:hypothetical protein